MLLKRSDISASVVIVQFTLALANLFTYQGAFDNQLESFFTPIYEMLRTSV